MIFQILYNWCGWILWLEFQNKINIMWNGLNFTITLCGMGLGFWNKICVRLVYHTDWIFKIIFVRLKVNFQMKPMVATWAGFLIWDSRNVGWLHFTESNNQSISLMVFKCWKLCIKRVSLVHFLAFIIDVNVQSSECTILVYILCIWCCCCNLNFLHYFSIL